MISKKLEVDTPALLLDIDAVDRNIQRMAEYFRDKKAHLRPHVKVHKSPLIAHKQIRAGAIGITCAKISEAEVMAQNGIDDILIANEIVGDEKIRRLLRLAKLCHLQVPVDDAENARHLSRLAAQENSKVQVLVDLNLSTDLNGIVDRCGVLPGETAVKLAREIAHLPNIEFLGLMGYEGGLRKFPEFASRKLIAEKALGRLIETKDMIEDNGINVGSVSCGGTRSYNIAAEFPGVTEVQAGSYVFMDANYQMFNLGDFETSLTLLASIVSRPRSDKAIIDAGLKAISADSGLPIVKGRPELECIGLNAEHGHIRIKKPEISLHQGDRLELVSQHVDTTVCLHNNYIVIKSDETIETLPISCRGKLQ